MTLKKNGLNNSDKIIVTLALWVCAITLFVTALTLPMLPSQVSMFYTPIDGAPAETYSKYNNLLLILTALFPAFIILIAAWLKGRNRLQNNFISIILFSIMLSLSMSCVILYGINKQFDSSSSVRNVNFHAICCIAVSFIASVIAALMPFLQHHRSILNKSIPRTALRGRLNAAADKYWRVGAYGFVICASACAFVPNVFSYIPLGVCIIVHMGILFALGKKTESPAQEQANQPQENAV